jgi:serine phosphatase RsbU (regulator of sigma subunit)
MDTVYLMGEACRNFHPLLERLGFAVIQEGDTDHSVKQIFEQHIIDIVVLESSTLPDPLDLINYLRNQVATTTVPVLVLGDCSNPELKDEMVEIVPETTSPGLLASKIATLLRMRKIEGTSLDAEIGQMNAALRDSNEKVKRDILEAQHIQQATLPSKIPQGNNFKIGFKYIPLEELGGDWFSVWQDSEGGIYLLIADVTGHGLAAAFIGGWINLALNSIKTTSPAQCLKDINTLITPLLPEGRFITTTCARFDPKTGVLKVARAGHPPSVLYRAKTNTCELLQEGGFAVGFMDEIFLKDQTVTLENGDIFVLLTDGILEAMNLSNKMYGIEGVDDFLKKAVNKENPEELINELLNNVKVFTDGRILKDDNTVLVLRKC